MKYLNCILTSTTLAYFRLIYPLICNPAVQAGAHFSGYLNNQWWQNNVLISYIPVDCRGLMKLIVISDRIMPNTEKSCFISLGNCKSPLARWRLHFSDQCRKPAPTELSNSFVNTWRSFIYDSTSACWYIACPTIQSRTWWFCGEMQCSYYCHTCSYRSMFRHIHSNPSNRVL